ncbi:hypothetical protein [Actinoplanes regularis]|uniref:hypothetical protein n=1 Tax=Actinoplanes regularis TaxID=52697 RepID=UPI0024A4D9DB|nr:hypothetical protein [Actinoplanes regularis]GLW31881.1 hypothetical protein Areg01_48200 [Actinoplanes regularis]
MDNNTYPIKDVTGVEPIAVPLIERNGLIGGEPGSGKSSLLNAITAWAELPTSAICGCESYDCHGECCGLGRCSCTPVEA